jgi:hypothetical protein
MAHARPDPSFPALLRRKKGLRSAGCPGRPALLARAHSPLSQRSAVAGGLGSGGGADPDHSLAWPRAGDRLTCRRTPCTLAQRSGRRRRAAAGTRSPGALAASEQRDARVPSSAGDRPRIFGARPFALVSPDSASPVPQPHRSILRSVPVAPLPFPMSGSRQPHRLLGPTS